MWEDACPLQILVSAKRLSDWNIVINSGLISERLRETQPVLYRTDVAWNPPAIGR